MKNTNAIRWFRIGLVAITLNIMILTFSSIGGFTFTPFASADDEVGGEGVRCPDTSTCTSGGCTTVATGGDCIYFPNTQGGTCAAKKC